MSKYMYAKMLWYGLFQLMMSLLVVFEQLDLSQELSQYSCKCNHESDAASLVLLSKWDVKEQEPSLMNWPVFL